MRSPQAQLLFARNFFRYPKVLGSLVPSSRFLVDQLLRHVDWQSARVLVEYGPGVGTFTGEILRRMHPDAVLIAIELNGEFVEFLGAHYPDPRLHVCRGSALEVDVFLRELAVGRVNTIPAHAGPPAERPRTGAGSSPADGRPRAGVDAVVSGIPFSTLGHDLRRQILEKTSRVLGPGGHFLAYQFSRALLPHLRGNFSHIREEFVPLNILPARIYCCTK